jgi:molybdate transport system substrate-binding protein
MSRRFLVALFAVAALAASALGTRAEEPPLIAAASDLQFAFPEVAAAFERQTGFAVRITFGSSGNFARQIRQGAPFELFLSADEGYVLGLARDGLTRDDGVLYGLGRIVIIAPQGSGIEPDGALEGLKTALREGRIKKFAIANPEHAPYGQRAEEALRRAGLWDDLKDKLVLGENVSQATQFALSGATEGGIVAYSLALSPKIAGQARFAPIPDDWHAPLRQRMVLLKGAGDAAQRFFDYLQEPAARAILRRFGFLLPGESA